MSKNRMIYATVLAIAMVVLIWDKCFTSNSISNPQSSQAAMPTGRPAAPLPPSVGTPKSIPLNTAAAPSATPANRTGGFLSTVLGATPAPPSTNPRTPYRDLFTTATQAREPATGKTTYAVRQDILRNVELAGTLVMQGSSTASINGKTYVQGDRVAGYRITEIAESYVILVSDEFEVTLYIEP